MSAAALEAGAPADLVEDARCDVSSDRNTLVAPCSFARLVTDAAVQEKPEGWTRFVCFSDTHGRHDRIPPAQCVEADVLLHAGDFTNTGEPEQVRSFVAWLQRYPAKHKVAIAGNHDITFQPDYYKGSWRRFHPEPFDCAKATQPLLDHAVAHGTKVVAKPDGSCSYLEDSSVEVMGYHIYGSPWQPEFCDWAFSLPRGEPCRAAWRRIPSDVDVVISHGPPWGLGDLCDHGERVGCEHLADALRSRIVPVCVAGHIHEGYGAIEDGHMLFVNASTCTLRYVPSNPPIVFDLPPAAELHKALAEVRGAAAAAPPDHSATPP